MKCDICGYEFHSETMFDLHIIICALLKALDEQPEQVLMPKIMQGITENIIHDYSGD